MRRCLWSCAYFEMSKCALSVTASIMLCEEYLLTDNGSSVNQRINVLKVQNSHFTLCGRCRRAAYFELRIEAARK